MKKTILPTAVCVIAMCLITACSKGGNKKIEEDPSGDEHTYHIEIADGKTYTGSVPRMAPGVGSVYNPVSFVEYSEEIDRKIISGMLQEAGKFQFGIGLALDEDNKPSISGTGPGLAFGEWGKEDKYSPAGAIEMTLKNYKEHSISMYGEAGAVASYILNFNGKFKLGTAGDVVDVTGEIVVAAP